MEGGAAGEDHVEIHGVCSGHGLYVRKPSGSVLNQVLRSSNRLIVHYELQS